LKIGIIGYGVMGKNLALNLLDKDFEPVVYDIKIKNPSNKKISLTRNLFDFIEAFGNQKKIIFVLVPHKVTKETLIKIFRLINQEDIVLNLGNSYFKDSESFHKLAKDKKFLSVGFSGGYQGARTGASFMVSGNRSTYKEVIEILKNLAAKDLTGGKSVAYIGEGGSGHFVKMIHNGIEYALMQLIAEVSAVLIDGLHIDYDSLLKVFDSLKSSKNNSYLLNAAIAVIEAKDSEGRLICSISDNAGQNGTGSWTANTILESNLDASTIISAVLFRNLSSNTNTRNYFKKTSPTTLTNFSRKEIENKTKSIKEIFNLSERFIFAQGINIILDSNKTNKWDLDIQDILRVWSGGSIIRGDTVNFFQKIYSQNPKDCNPFSFSEIQKINEENIDKLREFTLFAISNSIPVPLLTSMLSDIDAYGSRSLWTKLIQGQRDFFGLHGFRKNHSDSTFHYNWEDE